MFPITCIGGDLRQLYLASILMQKGYRVHIAGISQKTATQQLPCLNSASYFKCDELALALADSPIIIGPIPFQTATGEITSAYKQDTIHTDTLLSLLKKGQTLIAGMIPESVLESLDHLGISYVDYQENQLFAHRNAIATAEGAIAFAIEHSCCNLQKSDVLILGYGICGTVLADRCKAMGANVTVTGRRAATRMDAYRNDLAYLDITGLGDYLTQHSVSYIFNTIPHLVLPKELLVCLDQSCTIIDIASSPGGLDYSYVKEHELNATLYLGIPGKVAPKASAQVIYDIIKPYLIYQEQIKSNRKESSQCQQPL